jgi:CheY-like chemotaxis protein
VKKEPTMRRILIIDDDSQIRAVLREMLERSGYGVMDAPDGHVGLKLHRKNPADLVITDIVMPGKDGLSTIMEFKQVAPEVEIIAISGGGSVGPEDYLQMARELGVNRTLTKPFVIDDLLKVLRELQDEHNPSFTNPGREGKPLIKETVSFPV